MASASVPRRGGGKLPGSASRLTSGNPQVDVLARRATWWQPKAVSFDIFLELFGGRQPEAARQAVATVLRDLEATGPNELSDYELPIADLQMTRSTSEEPEPYLERLTAPGLDGGEELDGCAFFLHAFSPGIAQAIFRIADAGGLTILAVGDSGPLLPPSAHPAALPKDFPEPRRVTSGEELFTALSADYEGYARFRDRVTGTGARPHLAAWLTPSETSEGSRAGKEGHSAPRSRKSSSKADLHDSRKIQGTGQRAELHLAGTLALSIDHCPYRARKALVAASRWLSRCASAHARVARSSATVVQPPPSSSLMWINRVWLSCSTRTRCAELPCSCSPRVGRPAEGSAVNDVQRPRLVCGRWTEPPHPSVIDPY